MRSLQAAATTKTYLDVHVHLGVVLLTSHRAQWHPRPLDLQEHHKTRIAPTRKSGEVTPIHQGKPPKRLAAEQRHAKATHPALRMLLLVVVNHPAQHGRSQEHGLEHRQTRLRPLAPPLLLRTSATGRETTGARRNRQATRRGEHHPTTHRPGGSALASAA